MSTNDERAKDAEALAAVADAIGFLTLTPAVSLANAHDYLAARLDSLAGENERLTELCGRLQHSQKVLSDAWNDAEKECARWKALAESAERERDALAAELARVREAVIGAVPMNWCDSLLTGPNAGKIPLDCPGVERLLRGIRDRIAALAAPAAVPADTVVEAACFRWLCKSIADPEERSRRNDLLVRMPVMSYAAICQQIQHEWALVEERTKRECTQAAAPTEGRRDG
jgi:hypothetical protein